MNSFFDSKVAFDNALYDVERLFKSDATWEDKYDAIFNYAPGLRDLLGNMGFTLDYYDPDTSYEEDIVAYMNALRDMKTRLDKLQKGNT